jgi:hypothetical protein
MAEMTALLNQMTRASQDAHAALDDWMTDDGTPQIVEERVLAYRTLRAQWVAMNTKVDVDNDVASPVPFAAMPPSAPPGPEEGPDDDTGEDGGQTP